MNRYNRRLEASIAILVVFVALALGAAVLQGQAERSAKATCQQSVNWDGQAEVEGIVGEQDVTWQGRVDVPCEQLGEARIWIVQRWATAAWEMMFRFRPGKRSSARLEVEERPSSKPVESRWEPVEEPPVEVIPMDGDRLWYEDDGG